MHSDEVVTHRVSCTVTALAACPHPGERPDVPALSDTILLTMFQAAAYKLGVAVCHVERSLS